MDPDGRNENINEDERRIRATAEALLTRSLQSQRSSFTQHSINRISDIVLSEDLIAGARHQGRMSNVRRFFCLFITFDLLFTCLMWLICIMLAGDNVETAFVKQVVHYNIKTSLFDIVMAAVCRFTVLLLFYALLYINHWIIIALSTAATCAFLIAKVFLFDWPSSVQPVFEVLLILSSFVLAWSEAWFFDFRVIPQEMQARDWLIGTAESERAPLLQQFLAGPRSHYTESVANFYSPMESPEHSDTEENEWYHNGSGGVRSSANLIVPILPKLSSQKVEEYQAIASTTLNRAWELIDSPNWTFELETDNGDTVSSMHLPKPDGKIMKITGIINLSAQELLDELFQNIEQSIKWNKQLAESRKILAIDDGIDIVYQATVPAGGGIVGARDFIMLRCCNERNSSLISACISIPFADIPPRKNFVRGENGVGCLMMEPIEGEENQRCRLTWLLNTNLKGWLPTRLIDSSLSNALVDFMKHLRNHVHRMKE
ncbi:steroidogenic acute regulatory protein-like isoform X2 [Athalia rosae]|uniref:steroidogenic acute regulatory protein-like isoform X2 n=1 Tax=Athalia rosae TaxID=37344 RepID=UPI0020331EE9|nr:steroidogenic acute regulatory protein-like isoform X2 [Athalia rosae]